MRHARIRGLVARYCLRQRRIATMLRQFHCRGAVRAALLAAMLAARRGMRHQGSAAARAEGSGDATAAADRQSGDTADDDVARAATAVVDDRPPAVSAFRLSSTASSTPRACRSSAIAGALRHARATSIRAPRSKRAYRDVRRRVRRHAAPRLLRDEGELQPRDARPLRAAGQRLRHRVRRRARARDRRRRRSRARSCSPASARPTPKWKRRSPPASCASTSSRRRELERLDGGRRRGWASVAPVSFRVNPDVDPQTHPYIATGLKESKFGVAFDDAPRAVPPRRGAAAHRRPRHRHATSARRSPSSRRIARRPRKMLDLVDALAADGIALAHVDLGGGLGIRYRDEAPIAARRLRGDAARRSSRGRRERLLFEPGRLPRRRRRRAADPRLYLKPGAPKQLRDRRRGDERPAAPGALRRVARGRRRCGRATARRSRWDIVGPVCESARFPRARPRARARRRRPARRSRAAGAYAMAMSSNYNARPRACEVIVDGDDRASRAPPRDASTNFSRTESMLP